MKPRVWHGAVALAALVSVFVVRGLAAPAAPSQIDWPAGQEITYTLEWKTSTQTTALTAVAADVSDGQGALKTGVDVGGDLVLHSYGKKGDDFLVTARFANLSRASVTAFDQALIPSLGDARAELEGHEAQLVVKPDGRIMDVKFAAKDPALFRYLMQGVLTELSVSMKPGNPPTVEEKWTADLEGPSGRGPATFSRDAQDPFTFSRTRERYDAIAAWPGSPDLQQSLTSKGSFKVGRSGGLERVSDEESLEAARAGAQKDVVSRTSFTLEKKSAAMLDPTAAVPVLADPVSGAAPETEDEAARERRLSARTEGVTVDTILDEVKIHALVPKGKSGRWAWIAKGYFELHPEKTAELVDKMRGLDQLAKGYVIDLLVATAHPTAQAELVRAFRDEIIPPGREYALLVQRVGHLKTPTKETGQFFAQRYATAKAQNDIPARRATAITVGALAYHIADRDREEARALADPLVLDLLAAKEPKDRELLILAVGNDSLAEDARVLRLQAHDEVAPVRRAVASALRRIDDADVRTTLIEMMSDPDESVEEMAISSLDRRALSRNDIAAMTDQVRSGKTHDQAMAPLVSILTTRRENAPPEVVDLLNAIAERPGTSPDARQRALRLRNGEH